MKPFISLCMIVKNEEKVLGRCLESVKDIISEIIIVDTGSVDRTKDIAYKYTNRVYDFKWNYDFSEARNFAGNKATGEWILVLDADEYVDSKDLQNAIEQLKSTGNSYDVYAVNITNFTGVGGGQTVQHKHSRIYRNNGEIEFVRSIHEQLKRKDASESIVKLSSLMIYHSGYLSSTHKEKNKSERNTSLIKKEIEEGKSKGFDFFNMGNELRIEDKREEALEYYIKAYQEKNSFDATWIPFCLSNIIECLIELERHIDALEVIQDAEKLYPNTADFSYLKGMVFFAQKRFDDAKEVFVSIVDDKHQYTDVIKSVDTRGYLPNKTLSFIYEREKSFEKAIVSSINALNINRYCLESINRAIRILNKYHKEEEVFDFLSTKIFNDDYNKNELIKVLILTLNRGYCKLADLIMNKYFINDEIIREAVKLKLQIIKEGIDYNDITIESKVLVSVLRSNIMDTTDIYIMSEKINDNSKTKRQIQAILMNSNFKALYSLIIGLDNDEIKKVFDEDSYLFTLEKCIIYGKIELINKLLDLIGSLDVDINSKIANLLYRNHLVDDAICFYQMADEETLTDQDYNNIIDWLISNNNLNEAHRICFDALRRHSTNFELYKQLLLLNKQLNLNSKVIFNDALKKFKNSNWLALNKNEFYY